VSLLAAETRRCRREKVAGIAMSDLRLTFSSDRREHIERRPATRAADVSRTLPSSHQLGSCCPPFLRRPAGVRSHATARAEGTTEGPRADTTHERREARQREAQPESRRTHAVRCSRPECDSTRREQTSSGRVFSPRWPSTTNARMGATDSPSCMPAPPTYVSATPCMVVRFMVWFLLEPPPASRSPSLAWHWQRAEADRAQQCTQGGRLAGVETGSGISEPR
jgi:hypothetical protein